MVCKPDRQAYEVRLAEGSGSSKGQRSGPARVPEGINLNLFPALGLPNHKKVSGNEKNSGTENGDMEAGQCSLSGIRAVYFFLAYF